MASDPAYNYAIFAPTTDADHFRRFAEHVKVGQPAPDGSLTLLDGGDVQLRDLWQQSNLVVELGSLT